MDTLQVDDEVSTSDGSNFHPDEVNVRAGRPANPNRKSEIRLSLAPMVHTKHTFGSSKLPGRGEADVDVVIASKAEWFAWEGRFGRRWSILDKGSYVVAVSLSSVLSH